MKCTRAQELFSDYREGTLAQPLARELATHLEGCADCASLYRAFVDVTAALGAVSTPAAPDDLTAKLIAIAGRAEAPKPSTVHSTLRSPRWSTPPPRAVAAASWLAVAAALLLVMVFRPPELGSNLTRATSRTASDAYNLAVRTYHQTERWFEDLNVLRMTVGVAFEDRIDQINEQLRDLEDAGRRSDESDDDQSRHRSRPDPSSRSFS